MSNQRPSIIPADAQEILCEKLIVRSVDQDGDIDHVDWRVSGGNFPYAPTKVVFREWGIPIQRGCPWAILDSRTRYHRFLRHVAGDDAQNLTQVVMLASPVKEGAEQFTAWYRVIDYKGRVTSETGIDWLHKGGPLPVQVFVGEYHLSLSKPG